MGVASGPLFLCRSTPPRTDWVSGRYFCFFMVTPVSGADGFRRCNQRKPLRRARVAAAGQFVKSFLQSAGDGSGFAVSNGAKVDFTQAHDFGRRAADEDFVGNVKLVA